MQIPIIIEPLHEKYITLWVRVTQLESFLDCPYKFKFQPPFESNKEALYFWTMMHNTILPILATRKDREPLMGILCPKHSEYCRYWHRYLDKLQTYLWDRDVIAIEHKMMLIFEVGEFKLVLEWSVDAIEYTQDWKYNVLDLKTASKRWTEETYKNKLQKLIYSYMLDYLTNWLMNNFEYLILTKHKVMNNIELQTIQYTYSKGESENLLLWNLENKWEWWLIREYLNAYKTWIYTCNKSSHCRYCPLGPKQGKCCPLYTERWF